MIQNFDEVKKQLGELADVVNKFKSEAVQLRIVELVFAGRKAPVAEALDETDAQPVRKRTSKKRKVVASVSPERALNKKARASGKGAKGPLEQFITEGFFNQKRAIGDVVEHCNVKGYTFKANVLSGPLRRLVRENKLSRSKNAEGQFEYVKK